MVFVLPSIKDLALRARNALRSELPGTDAFLWPNNLYVTSKVFAGIVFEIFSKLAWLDKQRFASTATGYDLERHGSEYGIGRKAASSAYGSLSLIGVASYNLPSGSVFTRSDGKIFTSTSGVTLSTGGVANVTVIASAAGAAGNSVYGTTFTSTDTNITSSVVGSYGVGQGADIETDESLRARILFRKRQPPQGGAIADYIQWAETISGVTRVFVDSTVCGPGTVGVYFLMDKAYPATYGVPQAVDVAAVQAYIDTVKPVTAHVMVMAPTAFPIDVVITGISPNTYDIRKAAADELSALVFRASTVSTITNAQTIHRSWLWQAVSSVSGEKYHQITSPTVDVVIPSGYFPVVRNVSFI